MSLHLIAPCCLTLAAGRLGGRPVLLGVALRHPPVQLEARPAAELSITGARADAAYPAAAALAAAYNLPGAEIEIELAVPSHMGLGSSALAGLAAARALATLHQHGSGDLAADDALAAHAFASGGLLAVAEDGTLLRRTTLPNTDEASDWAFVMALPRVAAGTPETLEADRHRELWAAATALDRGAELLTETLWHAAVERNAIVFASALASLQALAPAPELSAAEAATLAVFHHSGALVAGRAPTGLALYGMVVGAEPSRELRRALMPHIGHTGGTVMATICDTEGARLRRS